MKKPTSPADLAAFKLDRARRAEFWSRAVPPEAYIDPLTVAAVVGKKPQTLEVHRMSGGGIPFVKINRRVYYRKCDVLAWLEQNSTAVASTSEAATVRQTAAGATATIRRAGAPA